MTVTNDAKFAASIGLGTVADNIGAKVRLILKVSAWSSIKTSELSSKIKMHFPLLHKLLVRSTLIEVVRAGAVQKEFDNHLGEPEMFQGNVISQWVMNPRKPSRSMQYRVMYSDGDVEDLSWKQVGPLLINKHLFLHRVRMRGRLLPQKPLCLHCILKGRLPLVKGTTMGKTPNNDQTLRSIDYVTVKGYLRICNTIWSMVSTCASIDSQNPEWLQLFGPEGLLIRTVGVTLTHQREEKHPVCNIVSDCLPDFDVDDRPSVMKGSVCCGRVRSTNRYGVVVDVGEGECHRGLLARRAGPLVQFFVKGDEVSVQVRRVRDAVDDNGIWTDLKVPDRLVYRRLKHRSARVVCCLQLEVLGSFNRGSGLFRNRPNARSFLVWLNRHFLISVWAKSPGLVAKCGLFNNLYVHSTVTGTSTGTLRDDRSRLQQRFHDDEVTHGLRTHTDTTVVFLRLNSGPSTYSYDTVPSELCFYLNILVSRCRVYRISSFVMLHIISFASSWCVNISTSTPEYGVRDTALCLGSPLCCKLLRVIGPGIMLGGYRRYLEGSTPEYNLPDPKKLFDMQEEE